ncbi:hemagglutinin repeat-containing protein [Burkholderia gladioli pv. alliicola]|uniref:hemagglutinin repeat-containing protein n=1 Tax=Burkholderia gladioli TaxID=28095 RepID=UPI003D8195DF
MNKNSHRLVFSRVHGMFVAVEETVHAPGRGNEGKSVVAARVPHLVARFALRQVAFAAWLAAGATPLTGKAQVAGSGAHAPSVIQTPNGLPQVNINKPGGGGVSLNTYSRFDVQKPGVIVNNSAVVTNTQQAGYINGNPNFGANDAARIIVNQVNSNNPSQLRGFIEIAGQRAEMIMSNPSGLVVDGGGFINTSRAILTTGTPNLNADGSLAGFNVTRGLIAVRGAGLDATNVDQVDLISRAIEANAAIHASTLNVVTGANRVDHDLLRATRIQGEGAAPAVAIDVGQLGGMYGNRIFLVGTEGGVGVRNAGTIAADAMGLTLNTDGRLTQAGKLSSLGNLVVSAVAGMENSGTTYAGQSASLDTGADVANAGALAAQHGVELRAGTLNSTGMLGSGVNGDGAVTQAGDLEVTTVGQLTATGLNIAGGKFSATGAGVNLAGGTTAAAGELSLRATTGDVNLANATTSAQGAATAKAAGTIANDHGVLTSSGSATLSGGTVSNQGGSVSSKGLLSVTAAEQIANQTGTLVSAGTMVLHGGKLANNQGTIQSEGHAIVEGATIDNTAGRIISLNADGLRLNTTGLLTNAAGAAGIGAQGGVITGNGDVTIQAASIRNTQGGQLSGANLQVLGTSLDNSGGRIGSVQDTNGDVDVTMNGAIANTGGQIGSNRDLTVKAATLQDGGAYKAARDAALSMQGDFSTTPDFQLNAGRNLVFTLSGTFSNGASIQAVNEVSIDAGNIVNRGTMMAGGLLRAQSADLVNSGSIVGGSTSINATGTASNLGPSALIGASDSQGTLEILAPDIENRDDSTATDATATAAILGMGTLVLAGGKDAASHYTNAALVNNSSALIQSGGDMQLHADKLVNKRRVMSTSTGSIDPATLAQFGIQIKGQTGQINVKDPNNIGGVYTEPPHEGHWNSDYHFTTYYADSATATTVAGLSPAAQIVSGGNIDASRSGTLRNYWSSITAVGNLQMPRYYDADGWAASGQQAPGVTVSYSGQYHYNNYNNQEHDWQLPFGNAPFVTRHPGGYTQAAPGSFKDYSLPDYRSTLGANGAISGTGVSVHNTAANASLPPLGLLPGQAVQGMTFGEVSGNVSVPKTFGGTVAGQVEGIGAQGVGSIGKPMQAVDPIVASATAQNVLSNLATPPGGLYKPNPSPNASYVVETNPAFTNQRNFISSDYFFSQIGVDLTHIPKRLGDGFHEQQLVRDEVMALTGKALLGPYTDLQTMYRSLMAAGAGVAKSLDLPIGASLSADQVSKLSGNVIMMETRVVDGQAALVPVVYLARAGQRNVNGPLISATDIDLKDTQDFTNSGTLKADNTLAIQGRQIDDAFGALQSGGLMSLTTTDNVNLISANVKAGSLQLEAGKDLMLDTATATVARVSRDGATSTTTTLGPMARLGVTGDAAITTGGDFRQNAGELSVGGNLGMNVGGGWDLGAVQTGEHKIVQRANGVSNTEVNQVTGSVVQVGGQSSVGVGGDLDAKGAQIDLGRGGVIAAKGNVTLGAASATSISNSNSSSRDGHGSAAQMLYTLDQSLTGTQLEGGGAVTIASGKDLSIIGSTVSLDKGNAILIAAGDVNIGATAETHELNSRETHSHGNIVSGAKIASGVDRTATDSQGSTVSADGIHIVSSRDINVAGSNVVGTNDVALQASRNVNITTSQDTTQSSSYYQKRESGLLTNGGLSLTVGSRSGAEQDQNRSVTNNASVIGSSQGNLSIQAGKDAAITGSTLVAGQNVGINAQNVSVNTAYDSYEDAQSQRFSQSGLSVGLGGGLLGLGQSMASTVRQGQQSGDSRLAAVQAVAAVGQTYRSRGGLEDAVGALSGGNLSEAAKGVQVQLGIGSSHSSNNVTTSITHAKGSSIIGNGDVSITARGSPDADGNAQAGTGNIALTGTSLLGKDVTLDANNAILLQSARSTEQGSSSNSSTGWNAGIAIGVGKSTGISVFANGSNAHGRGNGDSVTQTNTTVAASNTLTMKSGGDTALAGAQLSGDKVKADVGGNLTIASLQDTSSYGNNQHNAGGSGGFTLGPGGGGSIDASIGHTSIDSNYASVNQQTGIVAGKQGFDVEVAGHTQLNGAQIASVAPADHNTLTTNTLGFSDIQNRMSYSGSSEGISLSGGPSFAQTGDSASGVTHAAVSPAKIVVKSDQQNGTDSTAGLSRDTANANETVQSTFNLREVQNNLAFAHAFGKVATFALAEAATKLADSSPEMKTLFGEGGAGRDAMHAAVAAIGAALSGGNVGGAVAGSLAGDVLQSLAQPIVDQTVSQLPLSAQSAARNALNEIVATAGGAVGGALAGRGTSGALAGAGSAIGNEVYNRQLHEGNRADEKTLAKQLAVKSEGKYTQQQIEDQMRIMGGLIGGDRESGTPETLVGTMPTDSGAKWLYAGTTDDGKQILTQITVKPNAELQSYILANSAWAQDDVPSIMYDGAGKKSFGFEVTGPFTKFDPSDASYVKDTTADAAEAISVNAGRVSAAAGAAAAVPGPHSVAAVGLSVGAATVSLGASGVLQLVNPQPWGLGFDGFVDLAVFYESDRYPLAGPIFTEIGELIKNSAWANQIKTHLMESGGE